MVIEIFEQITASTASRVSYLSQSAEPITLRINSGGGDVFSALSIYNMLKDKNVTTEIVGLCASAATLLMCGAKKVVMCKNSLMMIHEPLAEMKSTFTAGDLSKVKNSLDKVGEMIRQIYVEKTGKSEAEIAELMTAETWYDAEEAVANGFADEIGGAVNIELNGDVIIANNIKMKSGKFDLAKVQKVMKGGISMSGIEGIREAEIKRIAELNGKRGENRIVNALIDVGITTGESAEKVQKYIDAVKGIKTDTAGQLYDLVSDNMNSGGEEILGSANEKVDEIKMRAKAIASFAS